MKVNGLLILANLISLLLVLRLEGWPVVAAAEEDDDDGGLWANKDLIMEFLQLKPITMSTIYYCNQRDILLANEFIERNLRVTAVDLRGRPGRPIERTGEEDQQHGFRQGFIVDMQCGQMTDILYSNPEFFKERQIYLLLWNEDLADEWLSVFQLQIGVRFDSDITIFCWRNGSLYDMYKLDNAKNAETRIIVQPNGQWNGSHLLDFNSQVYKVPERTDLQQIPLVGVFYLNEQLLSAGEPWTSYLTKSLDTVHDQTLFHFQLVLMLQQKFNFSIHYRRTNQWSPTIVSSNDSVPGELGMLHRREVAFMITPYRLTPDRATYADVTAITWSPQFLFLFRHPKSTSIRSQYLLPFQLSVWAIFALFICSFSIILAIHLQRSGTFENVPDRSFIGVFLWLIGYAVQQFSGDLPKLNSSRIMIVSVILMSFISYQYYTTFIVGSLIIERPKTIKTLADLIHSGLEIGTTTAVYTRDLFTATKDPQMIYIYEEKIEKKGNKLEIEDGVKRIKDGSMAYHHDQDALYGLMGDFTDHEICDLTTVVFFRSMPCSMQVGKTTGYRELFVLGLQPMIESGVADMERLKIYTSKPKCVKSEVEVNPVDFDTITVPLMAMAVGVGASLVILVLEIIIHRITINKKSITYLKEAQKARRM